MTCPHGLRPTLPGLCRHGSAALGVFPGAPPPPAPPLGSKGSFLKPPPIAADRPQGCALAPGPQVSPPPQTPHMHARPGAAPPWGGHLADSQIPPISYKLASLWLRVKLLPQPHPQRCQLFCAALSFLPKDPLVPHPQRPALGGSSLLPSPCLQHPVLCLPVLTMEGIGYETKSQTRYMQYLFV